MDLLFAFALGFACGAVALTAIRYEPGKFRKALAGKPVEPILPRPGWVPDAEDDNPEEEDRLDRQRRERFTSFYS